MITKQERLKMVYSHLRSIGVVHTITDFAEAMGRKRPGVSSALNGNEIYLTDELFNAVYLAWPDIFSLKWLQSGEGEMLVEDFNKESDQELKTALELKWAKHEITILNELVESLKRENALLHQQLKGKGFDDLLNLPFHHGVADVTQPETDDVSRV